MDAAAEIMRNIVSKHQIQPEHDDEQADAGRDCLNHLARPNFQVRTGTGKYSAGLSSVTIFRLGNVCRGKQPPRFCTLIGGR